MAFCGCLKSSPHLDSTIAQRGGRKKDIKKERNEMDLLRFQKQMGMDSDRSNSSIAGMGLSLDDISVHSNYA